MSERQRKDRLRLHSAADRATWYVVTISAESSDRPVIDRPEVKAGENGGGHSLLL